MLVGYARVSTEGQDLTLQLEKLKEAGCERIFSEKVSGAKADRPELEKAIDFARADDTLVIWKLDRLGRDMKGLLQLSERLAAKGVGLKSLTDPIDTTGPSGRFFFNIMASFAELEREMTRERTIAGLEAARAANKRPGPSHKLSPQKRLLGLAMFEKGGVSVKDVAAALGCHPVTIYRTYSAAERQQAGSNIGRPRKSRQLELGVSA